MGGHLTREEKKNWKEETLSRRTYDFLLLKEWLKSEKIEFENHDYFIKVKDLIVEYNLKVIFSSGRKKYQYEIEQLKQRILK